MIATISQHFLTNSRGFGADGKVTSETRPDFSQVRHLGRIVGHYYNPEREVLILVWEADDAAAPAAPAGSGL